MFNIEQARTQAEQGRTRRSEGRSWFKVRVATDEGIVLGSLRMGSGHGALRDLLDNERAYLSLWDARREGSDEQQEFLAIHKNVIRHVAVLGPRAQDDHPRGDAAHADSEPQSNRRPSC